MMNCARSQIKDSQCRISTHKVVKMKTQLLCCQVYDYIIKLELNKCFVLGKFHAFISVRSSTQMGVWVGGLVSYPDLRI